MNGRMDEWMGGRKMDERVDGWMDGRMNKFFVIRNRKWTGQLQIHKSHVIKSYNFTNERLNGISMVTQAVVTLQGPEFSLGARAHHAYTIHFITITNIYIV